MLAMRGEEYVFVCRSLQTYRIFSGVGEVKTKIACERTICTYLCSAEMRYKSTVETC